MKDDSMGFIFQHVKTPLYGANSNFAPGSQLLETVAMIFGKLLNDFGWY
jgi:hypothetical protein